MINLLDDVKEQINNMFVADLKLDGTYQLNSIPGDALIINLHENINASILINVNYTNKKIIVNLDKNAQLDFNIASFDLDNENQIEVNLDENSEFNGAYADFSSNCNKFKFTCNLNGTHSKANWHLATLLKDSDLKSFEISFYHNKRDTYAKMENYGVCEDQSNLNFLGTSKINKGAKSSATHQSAKIMVFDKKCVAKASPTLCIDENDVQASHAAVVGQINEDHIFYLMSRGIEEKEAKKLITLGYLMPILNHFNDAETINGIKDNIEKRV